MADRGRVINIGTALLAITTAEFSAYAGSKPPLEDSTRALAKDVGSRGITVNTIAPDKGVDVPVCVTECRQSVGDIKDIVPVVEFIASPDSQWVTAQTLFVNGGVTSR
ncbi:hypothetical protein BGX30_004980 [Mortierella sp. GBA39]|nr:hypothetical protein BGX30_004980 [Mortierella sp. GBA39]